MHIPSDPVSGPVNRQLRSACSASPISAANAANEGQAETRRGADRPGGVVIGGDYQGLGIVRSLGRRGIPVCVIDDEASIARFSRYSTRSVQFADLRNEKRAVDSLLRVGRELGLKGWVLFPTREETVAALSRFKAQLSEWYRVPTPGWDSVQWAWDKRKTYLLADRLGIPTPRTWQPRDQAALAQIEGDPPFAIKPAIKEHFFYATKAKAWLADSQSSLRELFGRATAIAPAGEIMVQEFIPGHREQQFAYCAFFKDGRALGSMVVQRLRQHPASFGRASTYVRTVDLPTLETLSERFLCEIGYYGLVEMEYKLDLRDGKFKLLDVNARTWGYHSVGQRAAVDFPYMQFADQIGETVEPCRARPGIGWIRLVTDVPAAAVELWQRRLTFRSYLQSLKDSHTEAVFCLADLLPGVVELALIPYLMAKRGF